jgi:muramidase (phage lysozyme)
MVKVATPSHNLVPVRAANDVDPTSADQLCLDPAELLAMVEQLLKLQAGALNSDVASPEPIVIAIQNRPRSRTQATPRSTAPTSPTSPTSSTSPTSPTAALPGGTLGKLMTAISGQESSHRYNAVNPQSGALGRYQVMPKNIAAWSKEALGYSITPRQFLNSPELQDKIVQHKLGSYLDEGMRATGNADDAVRYAAAKWYSGDGNNYRNTRPQYYRGHPYPSIAAYSDSVLRRFHAA